MGQTDFRRWIKTSDHFTRGGKVRVIRRDGTRGYSIPRFELYPTSGMPGQIFWQDMDGTLRERDYYTAYAYLKKDGGKV